MSALTGTVVLVRLALRRDRVRLPMWLGGLTGLLAVVAAANAETYATDADRTAAATLLAGSPALRLVRGAAAGPSLGALIMSDAFWLLSVSAALLSGLTVIRHTRQNEETGRGELTGSAPVGPRADLAAALLVAVAANLTLAGLLTLALSINGLPAAGSMAAGAGVAGAGIAFAGIAALAAQISPSARTCNALVVGAVAVAYLLRGIGAVSGDIDPGGVSVTSAWPSWLSPIGWGQHVHPFAGNTWWVLALPIALFTAAAVLAFTLSAHRDFGLGMLPAGTGPPAARRSLLSPLGLAWRLQRGVLLGWAIGMFFGGALFGSLGQQVADLSNNPQFVQMMNRLGGAGASLTDTFFAAAMALLAAISAGYPLQALLRMHSEESDGRLEPVLAAAVGRTRWVAGHLTSAVLGTVGLLLLAGAGAGLADALVTGETTTRILTLTQAAAVQASAPLILAGFVVAAYGLLPRWTEALSWTALTLSLLLGPLGEILNLPEAARNLSPFSHTPAAPAAEITASLTLAPLAVAAALTAIGLAGFHRRNLALPA